MRHTSSGSAAVVVTIGPHTCAIPVAHVVETMRQLVVTPIAGAPSFVRGLSVIRGAPVPVLDLAAVLGLPASHSSGRLVVLGIGPRRVALAVDGVLGVTSLDATATEAVAPLLQSASRDALTAIGTLDEKLLLVLESAQLVADHGVHAALAPEAST